MKRILVFLLAMVLMLSCVACSVVQKPPEENKNTDILPENPPEEKINEAEIAKQAYDLIDRAEAICKEGMETVSFAWHFGIYDAPDCKTDVVIERLSAQIGFDVSFVKENGGHTADELVNGKEDFPNWEFCLATAENCLYAFGAYTAVDEALETARDLIRKLPDSYANYGYLKDYYTKVAAYAEYFKNISGSYNDLRKAVDDYESQIQTAKQPLVFDLG